MEEKRKHKRLDLDVNVQLERLDQAGITTVKYIHVDVTDLSRSGIGFKSQQLLEIGTYYDAKIQIWTKEVIDIVIQVVRRVDKDGGYQYGGSFIGMTETDALKIDIYQIFNELG
jgi:D-mannonate dehydratase